MNVICYFKQKTAYEMRISDWSSDVCSSDLLSFTWRPCAFYSAARFRGTETDATDRRQISASGATIDAHDDFQNHAGGIGDQRPFGLRNEHSAIRCGPRHASKHRQRSRRMHPQKPASASRHHAGSGRSEEHTSELQSLMRNS